MKKSHSCECYTSWSKSIPKMTYLVEILTEAGLENVKTYIQSGNIVFETDLADDAICTLIHDTIKEKIGADLSVVLKEQPQLTTAIIENPFDESYDVSRVHLVFTNDQFSQDKLADLLETDFGDEILRAGSECLYLYLPREAKKTTEYQLFRKTITHHSYHAKAQKCFTFKPDVIQ